jgi:hypothetical protein
MNSALRIFTLFALVLAASSVDLPNAIDGAAPAPPAPPRCLLAARCAGWPGWRC